MINYKFISNTLLFRGISPEELEKMFSCLAPDVKKYKKNAAIYRTGDSIKRMGFVLSGSVNILRCDVWGSQNILDHVNLGQVFAEAYACSPGEPLMVNVDAAEPETEILFLDVDRMLHTCSSACDFHSILLRNLLTVLASKNINLTRKMAHITPRTIRDRLLSYLSHESLSHGSYSFVIPFDRQQLADYLSVERSALSNELSKMQRQGLITCHKNLFTVHCPLDD